MSDVLPRVPPPKPEPECNNCKYFDPQVDPESDQGYCRRYPPMPVVTRVLTTTDTGGAQYEPAVGTFWPQVNPTDWCGEWETP
jgi:hypothetical protein